MGPMAEAESGLVVQDLNTGRFVRVTKSVVCGGHGARGRVQSSEVRVLELQAWSCLFPTPDPVPNPGRCPKTQEA